MNNDFDASNLIDTWEAIAKRNHWINQAYDPVFDKSMLIRVNTLRDLELIFQYGNWCLGQGFYFRNLCFINQIDGGDEWLTIKDDYAFESITFEPTIKRGGFNAYLERLLNASKEDCINLNY